MGDPLSTVLTRRTFTLRILHTSLRTVYRSPQLVVSLTDGSQMFGLLDMSEGATCQINSPSGADNNRLVRRGGGRRQIGESEHNREVTGVISVSVSFSLIRPLAKQITGIFLSGFLGFFVCMGKCSLSFFWVSFWMKKIEIGMYQLRRVVKASNLTCGDVCVGCQRFYQENEQSESSQGAFFECDLVLYCRILAAWWLGTCCLATLIIPVCQRWEHSWPVGMAAWNSLERFCGWLRLCRPEITSATGCVPGRQDTGWLWRYLPGISFTEKGEVILKSTGQLREYPGEYTVMKSECATNLGEMGVR